MGEVKSLVSDLEKELKSFEKQVEPVGQFTDLLQLGKMKIHGGIMLDQLRSRRGNVEDAQLAELEAEENAPPPPEAAPEPEPAPVAPEPVPEAESAPVVDPAAGLVAQPETPEKPAS
jgi:hypothetical protein